MSLLVANGGKYTSVDLDKYLGAFNTVALVYRDKRPMSSDALQVEEAGPNIIGGWILCSLLQGNESAAAVIAFGCAKIDADPQTCFYQSSTADRVASPITVFPSAERPSRNFLRKSRLETQVRAHLPIPQKGRVKEEPWQSTAGALLALRWLSQNGRIQLKNRRAWL
jgi:hypothetical protein